MRGRLAWLLGLAGLVAYLRRRRSRSPQAIAPASPADELRRKLEESRELAGEQEEFDAGETPVDLDERRRQVHEAGRAALDEMKGDE